MSRRTLPRVLAWLGGAILLAAPLEAAEYQTEVRPLLAKYCLGCHEGEEATAGIRLDRLDGRMPDNRIRLWDHILSQIDTGEMPPADEPQPSAAERKTLTTWIGSSLTAAKSRERPKNGPKRP